MNKKFIVCILMICMCLLSACSFNSEEDKNVYTGTIECDDFNISSEIAGAIKEIAIKEGDFVKRGDLIARIDVEKLNIELEQTNSGLTIAKSNLNKLETGPRSEEIKKAMAKVEQAKTLSEGKEKEYNYRLENYNKLKALHENAVVSEQNVKDAKSLLDHSKSLYESGKKEVEAMQYQLDLLVKGTRSEEIEMAVGQVQSATSTVEMIKYKISKANIKSPIDGVIENVNYNKGEIIPVYGNIANILDLKNIWVKIYIPEKELHKVSIGKELDIKVDFIKDQKLKGKVIFISKEAEFTPKNVESKENKQEMVFAVKIKIDESIDDLKPGMLIDVNLGGENK
ncbi:HlyD family efflux transporter periplasmic adaptor subunit [Lutibacter sp. B2]|nr:HlyD family efflux transporter periplasmic adaptor subunit [Lutibacter sp. B2]